MAAHRVQERVRIIADTVLEHRLDILQVGDVARGVAPHQHQIGVLPRRDRTDAMRQAKTGCAVERADADLSAPDPKRTSGYNSFKAEIGFDPLSERHLQRERHPDRR
jgi:hypothetical protein